MHFKILGQISEIETIAKGKGIRELARLNRLYGRGRWRKRKGLPGYASRMAAFAQPKYSGTKLTASDAMKTRSSAISIDRSATRAATSFALCVQNKGYEASLERGKIYRVLRDEDAENLGQLRVIDESGEDYLFPKTFFVPLSVTPGLRRKILRAV